MKNILDYGAVGDGIEDDTEAIQAALDAAKSTGEEVRVPVGSYLISKTIQWPMGGTYAPSPSLIGEGAKSRLVLSPEAGDISVLRLKATSPGSWYGGEWACNGRIENICIDMPVGSGTALELQNVNYFSFRNLRISGGARGIYAGPDYSVYFCEFSNIHIAESGQKTPATIGADLYVGGSVLSNFVSMDNADDSLRMRGTGNKIQGGEFLSVGGWSIRDCGLSNVYEGLWVEGGGIGLYGENATLNLHDSASRIYISPRARANKIMMGSVSGVEDYSATTEYIQKSYTRYVSDSYARSWAGFGFALTGGATYSAEAWTPPGPNGDRKVAVLGDLNDGVAWYMYYSPYVLSMGQYEIFVHAMASEGVADDLKISANDNNGTAKGSLGAGTFSPTGGNVLGWIGPLKISIGPEQYENVNGDTAWILVQKATSAENCIKVDAVRVDRVGPYI